VSDETGREIEIYEHKTNEHSNCACVGGSNCGGVVGTVTTLRTDDFVKSANVCEIAAVKMDVEGFELKALRGMEKTIAEHQAVSVNLMRKHYNAHPLRAWSFLRHFVRWATAPTFPCGDGKCLKL
jgi:FkbM family methyltransferase